MFYKDSKRYPITNGRPEDAIKNKVSGAIPK